MMPDRFVHPTELIDPVRWPYAVTLSNRYVTLNYLNDDIAHPEVIAWLDAHAPNGDWRLSLHKVFETVPKNPEAGFIMVMTPVRQVHLSDADAAFAFRLRFG